VIDELDARPLVVGDVEIVARPLRYEKAEDLLAEVTHFVAASIAYLIDHAPKLMGDVVAKNLKDADVMKLVPLLMPSIAQVSKQLSDGNMLKRLAPPILAATTVTMPDATGERQEYHLVNVRDRATVFDRHPGLYYPTVFHAGRVTFGPFFNVKELLENLLKNRQQG
jgi:hypothetical protein